MGSLGILIVCYVGLQTLALMVRPREAFANTAARAAIVLGGAAVLLVVAFCGIDMVIHSAVHLADSPAASMSPSSVQLSPEETERNRRDVQELIRQTPNFPRSVPK